MSRNEPSKPAFSDHGDGISGGVPARVPKRGCGPILALLLGLGSAASLIHPALWVVAGVGIAVSTLVLMRQARDSSRSAGRGLAVAGLVLSVLFATWAPTQHYVRQWHVRQQSERVGIQWLEFLFRNEPRKAYGAMLPPEERGNLNETFQKRILADPSERAAYETFANRALIRKLILLDGRARPIFHAPEQIITSRQADEIHNVYEIRYLTDAGGSESFLLRLVLRRTDNPVKTSGLWQVVRYSSIPNSSIPWCGL